MKITDVRSTIVCIPYTEVEPWAWGTGHYGVNALLVQVATDTGIEGIGEGTSAHAFPEYGKLMVDSAKQMLVEEDPFDIENIMRRLWAKGLTDPKVMSGIEMALWDIIGKSCSKPLYKLLGGGLAGEIPFAPWLNRKKTEDMANKALELSRQGFKAFYIKVGIDPIEDVEAVKAVRHVVGDKVAIMVDANMAWSVNTAIKMIKKLERYDIEFVEDPTYSDGMKRVKQTVDTPIASGAETVYDIFRVVKNELADIIAHIDPKMQGGILNCKKACAIAEAAGMPVVGHAGWELSIGTQTMLHIAASTPNFILPNQTYYMYLTDDICQGGMRRFENGYMPVSEKPGLGVEVDWSKVEKYSQSYKERGGFSIYEEPVGRRIRKILPYQIY